MVSTTRSTICLTLDSRSAEASFPRKYLDATTFVAVWDQNFDALLLEDGAALATNRRVAELPLDLVVRVDALAGKVTLDPEAFRLGALDGFRRDVCDCHVRRPLESREVRAARQSP